MIALDDWFESDRGSHEQFVERTVGPEPETLIGKSYRVVRPIGSGSMGVVVLAHDDTLDRPVAIKFTHPSLAGEAFGARFLAEARAMARVNHPNVVQVHAFGEHEGNPYFVMEFVLGQTLEQWLGKGRPDLDVALRILDEICRGLTAIHSANAVHYDIKPSNILLDENLRPRIADLGLSMIHRQGAPRTHEIMGTPAYMAPEVAFSREIDPSIRSRADVYSLACVAYELFTGRPPFDGVGSVGLLLQHAMKPVTPPSQVRPGLPPDLDRALLRALAKEPQERTPTAEALRLDLIGARERSCEPTRILVAEDDEDSREALRLILALNFPHADIECVGDGLAALAAYDRKPPSVAILDLQMPGIDGMELTKVLRFGRSSPAMPIIVITAAGGPNEWRRLAALGADRLLVKPVILDDVVTLVRRSLAERSGGTLQVIAQ